MMPSAVVDVSRPPLLARPIVRLVLLIGVIAAGHGLSVTSGLWLDDHLHYRSLRDARWTYRDLIDASTLDNTTTHSKVWGRMEGGLRFFRPVAFGLMKAEYTLVGWRPAGMHVFSLAWHLLGALLIGTLVTRLLRDGSAGTFAAALFAVFPNHAATVYWIACQTELIVTVFVLAAVLAYGTWAGWFQQKDKEERAGKTSPHPASRTGWLALSCLFFGLAMGCRENAIVLPGILVAGDILTHGLGAWRRRLGAWALMALLVGGYLLLRHAAMGGMAWPRRPYLITPADPDFLEFVTRKMLYYLSGLFLYLPILPGSAAEYFEQKTWLLPIGAAASLLTPILALLLWRRGIVLLGVVWIILIFAPSIGVALSPHHLYLPSVGSILLLTAAGLGLWRAVNRYLPALARLEPVPSGGLCAVLLTASTSFCIVTGWLYVYGTAAEDQVVADVLERGDRLASGDELFFINLPLMCGWPGPAIETAAGDTLRNLKAYALTLSDEVMMMTQPTEVIPLDRHRLRLRTASPGWLTGTAGEIFAELGRMKWPFEPGQVVPGPAFDVTVEALDEETGGITQLLVVFHEPMDKPGRHFYLGSPYQMAYPLHFTWRDGAGLVTGP